MWADKNFRSIQLNHGNVNKNSTVLTAKGNVNITGDINLTGSLLLNDNQLNSGDDNIISVGFIGSGAKNEISTGEDIGNLITSLLTSDNIIIEIYSGSYTLTTSIVIRYNNIVLKGQHRENTTLTSNISSDYIIDINNTSSKTNITLKDFTINNTSYANLGIVGIYMKEIRNANIQDINIQYCRTAIEMNGRNFYNNFYNIRTNSCYDTIILSGVDNSNKPNENTFISCCFLNNENRILDLQRGNSNTFYRCCLEHWGDYAVYIDNSNGNTIDSCRMEDNGVIVPNGYIYFSANSSENIITKPYISDSGTSWVSFSSSIIDLGSGNCIDTLNSFKTQKVQWKRGQSTADDFIEFIRTGSGDNKSILTLDDQYPNSGNPIQLLTKSSRYTGKSISCEYNDTEIFSVSNNGNVGIGSSSPTKVLDVASTSSGIIPPRMTTTQRDAISSPVAGEFIYNTTTNKLCCYNGTIWNDCF